MPFFIRSGHIRMAQFTPHAEKGKDENERKSSQEEREAKEGEENV
jgi:hypothetical protein